MTKRLEGKKVNMSLYGLTFRRQHWTSMKQKIERAEEMEFKLKMQLMTKRWNLTPDSSTHSAVRVSVRQTKAKLIWTVRFKGLWVGLPGATKDGELTTKIPFARMMTATRQKYGAATITRMQRMLIEVTSTELELASVLQPHQAMASIRSTSSSLPAKSRGSPQLNLSSNNKN